METIETTYLTVEEAGARLGRSARTIRRWHRTGQLPGRLVLRRLVFSAADVERMAISQCAS